MSRSLPAAPVLILSRAQALPPVSRLVLMLAQTVVTWDLRRQGRRALRRLDDHLLNDIGLAPDLASTEGAKPFWRA